ncbi:hypothetical protein IEQ34_005755 [Dendrobium chrysotoxum]|uniref:Uncharacterized protein n=1 Tax=Dendrobium chrysotoxum TaxID=161865 RepID=A0AAV7HB11_DENCH|nr:hypothetical protein IEQ34_005755 [Dendrobium chrysotoxum]
MYVFFVVVGEGRFICCLLLWDVEELLNNNQTEPNIRQVEADSEDSDDMDMDLIPCQPAKEWMAMAGIQTIQLQISLQTYSRGYLPSKHITFFTCDGKFCHEVVGLFYFFGTDIVLFSNTIAQFCRPGIEFGILYVAANIFVQKHQYSFPKNYCITTVLFFSQI